MECTGLHSDSLPCELSKAIGGCSVEPISLGESGAGVFLLRSDGKANRYLKITERSSFYSVRREHEVLTWLAGKLPVPQVLHFDSDEQRDYLLTSEVEGLHACDERLAGDVPAIVRLLAAGLRLVHAVDISQCPLDQRLDSKLSQAAERVKAGLVDTEAFEAEWMQLSPNEILDRLVRERPPSEDLVFTHGDYCLPNIVIRNGEMSGFIDWGSGGVADRYQDLALAARSLGHNWGEEWVPMLFNEYGLPEPDAEKLEYYKLMDELF